MLTPKVLNFYKGENPDNFVYTCVKTCDLRPGLIENIHLITLVII